MNLQLAERVAYGKPSLMLSILEAARRKEGAGEQVYHLEGEMDFPTPEYIRQAATQAIDEGFVKYTPPEGLLELRHALAETLHAEHGVACDPITNIIVTPGAKTATLFALLSLVNKGDEVLIFEPAYPPYLESIRIAEGIPVCAPLDERHGAFILDMDAFVSKITPKTRGLIINYPANPTAWAPTKDELETIARVASDRGLWIISDEAYGCITFEGYKHWPMLTVPGAAGAIMLNSFSKTFAMMGWRLGYAIGPAEVISKMTYIQMQSTTCVPAFIQRAALAALNTPRHATELMVKEYERRQATAISSLNEMGVSIAKPRATYFLFPNFSWCGVSSQEICEHLLAHASVAMTPGIVFGPRWDHHVRISLTCRVDELQEAMRRVGLALKDLVNAQKDLAVMAGGGRV